MNHTDRGFEWRRSLGDSLLDGAALEVMQALFSEWTLLTWLAGLSKVSKPLWVRCTRAFLSSGMVSRGLMTESVPWQLRVDIFVTHIWQNEGHWYKLTNTNRQKLTNTQTYSIFKLFSNYRATREWMPVHYLLCNIITLLACPNTESPLTRRL